MSSTWRGGLVVPAFVAACVVYILLPISMNPAMVILPFALLIGLAVRIAFERVEEVFLEQFVVLNLV